MRRVRVDNEEAAEDAAQHLFRLSSLVLAHMRGGGTDDNDDGKEEERRTNDEEDAENNGDTFLATR
jgi:hypothetical protein